MPKDAGLAWDFLAGRLPLIFQAKANRGPDADHPDGGLGVGKQAINGDIHSLRHSAGKKGLSGGNAPLKWGGIGGQRPIDATGSW